MLLPHSFGSLNIYTPFVDVISLLLSEIGDSETEFESGLVKPPAICSNSNFNGLGLVTERCEENGHSL